MAQNGKPNYIGASEIGGWAMINLQTAQREPS